MGWLLRHNWLWALLAFLLGAVITWFLLTRRHQPTSRLATEPPPPRTEPLVTATVGTPTARTTSSAPTPQPVPSDSPKPAPAKVEEPVRAKAEEPAPAKVEGPGRAKVEARGFSRRMEGAEPTLFDEPEATAVPEQLTAETGAPASAVPEQAEAVPPGRYGEGSADAVPHQGPPDGFTIKGNAQSMLFHTPDSPYYGRTKPEVWFRTEADAERAGFTKYTRKPRKSPGR